MSEPCYTLDVGGASFRRPEILQMWNDGMRVKDIVRIAKCSERTLHKVIEAALNAGFESVRKVRRASSWNKSPEEQFAAVKRLYLAGRTYTEIGGELGLTKGSVAGLIKRMGLSRSSSVKKHTGAIQGRKIQKANGDPFAPLKAKSEPKAPSVIKFVCTEEDLARAKTLLDLGSHECRFPLNAPDMGMGETTLFCAKPALGTYCKGHRRLCMAPAPSSSNLSRLASRVA